MCTVRAFRTGSRHFLKEPARTNFQFFSSSSGLEVWFCLWNKSFLIPNQLCLVLLFWGTPFLTHRLQYLQCTPCSDLKNTSLLLIIIHSKTWCYFAQHSPESSIYSLVNGSFHTTIAWYLPEGQDSGTSPTQSPLTSWQKTQPDIKPLGRNNGRTQNGNCRFHVTSSS